MSPLRWLTALCLGPGESVIAQAYGKWVPRLSEFYGIAIYMYFSDHGPPHFHAIYAGAEAQVRIADGGFLAGNLPTTASRLVRQWASSHRDELLADWARAQANQTLIPIEPLR